MSDFFLADDLSGALDAAAAFHRAGQRVTIALSLEAWPAAAAGEVIGFTTETRNAAPAVAMEAVTRAIAHGRGRGGRLVYKKIDSTLRGPVAAELAALEAAMPETRILFTPANPAAGRTVEGGVLRVKGVPVAETNFARDPVTPVRESSIRALLGDSASARVAIADATTDADLAAAVGRVVAVAGAWVAVGSGALARPVAAARFPTRAGAGTVPLPALTGPILFVCGSAHSGNRAQAELLAREHQVTMHEVSVAGAGGSAAAAVRELAGSGAAILMIQAARTESEAALDAISAAALHVIRQGKVRRIFATGGETAYALCRALGISTLSFCREIEPGLSLSRAETPTGPLLFAIKPGGFGDSSTWTKAWNAFHGMR